jgi:hypothetical protein
VTLLHLGPLHPFAQTLVLLLAFGPFVVLGVVVWVVRRRDIAEEEACSEADRARAPSPVGDEPGPPG